MTIKEALIYGRKHLEERGIEDASIIAKVLIEYVLKVQNSQLILIYDDVLEDQNLYEYKNYLRKIIEGIPMQYITNCQEFMNLNFYVDENVLIPQPDTEILVEEVIDLYKNQDCKILDLCTGSGAIGISLAKYIEKANITASDISEKAIQIAKLNAERNLVHRKMSFFQCDMFSSIELDSFDAVVSNPPYIETETIEHLDRQVKNEPHIALDGGKDGLDFYRAIADNCFLYVKDKGRLFLEIGYNQKEAVIDILKTAGKYTDIYSKKDLSGNDRIVVATIRR